MLISLQPVFIRPFSQEKETQSMQFIGDVVVGNAAQFHEVIWNRRAWFSTTAIPLERLSDRISEEEIS
jgi:hypothetical protein